MNKRNALVQRILNTNSLFSYKKVYSDIFYIYSTILEIPPNQVPNILNTKFQQHLVTAKNTNELLIARFIDPMYDNNLFHDKHIEVLFFILLNFEDTDLLENIAIILEESVYEEEQEEQV